MTSTGCSPELLIRREDESIGEIVHKLSTTSIGGQSLFAFFPPYHTADDHKE
jgi:hypothetical protein